VIYNPTSGRKTNIRDRILEKLTANGIEARFYETERYMHAWELVSNAIDFDEHSALVAVGGDGTLHEVINGMLFRADKKKLPVSFVPHGTGNDLVGCLGTRDVD
jgi:diacylglycerol kinase (ATP)